MATIDESTITRPLIISPDTLRGGGNGHARIPPGQVLTRKWPVLHYGSVPHIDPETWTLRVWGLCENPYTLDYEQFMQLPQVDVKCDIHCVTHWTRLDNVFTGVQTKMLIELAKPSPEAKFVMQHATSAPGNDWTTNLPRDAFTAEDCVLAIEHDGRPLEREHGYPVRAVVPRLYFWKGAKWLSGLELRATDAPGFWEVNGYHMHGDPWREERYGW